MNFLFSKFNISHNDQDIFVITFKRGVGNKMPFLNIFLLLLILNCHEGLKVTSFSYQCDNSFQTF